MSFRLIRNQRFFGELHKIFATNPIYPDERVKPVQVSRGTPSAKSQRDRRLYLLLKQDKMSTALKQYIYGINEKDFLLNNTHDLEKASKHSDVKESLDDVSSVIKSTLDPDTNLPVGMGFDSMIKVVRENNITESSQDKLRDIWMNLGFYSRESVISATPDVDIGDSLEKINRKIFTSRHKITPSPYKGVFNERNPRSEVIKQSDPEYFSLSSDDVDRADAGLTGIKRAKEKYEEHLINQSDDEIEKFSDQTSEIEENENAKNKDKDENFDHIEPSNPLISRQNLKIMNMNDINLVKHNIRMAGRLTAKKIKRNRKPLFKLMDRDDFVKKADLEYEINTNYGPVPSFAEIVAEAEEMILNNPILLKQYQVDEYKKNVQFHPRYLGKEVSVEDYHWSFMPHKEEALFPGYMTGKYPYRQSSENLIKFDGIASRSRSGAFMPDNNDLSRKSLSLMKKDPNHEHYLKNHLMMWFDDYRKHINFMGFGKENKTTPVVPWEYLKIQKPNELKIKKELKVEVDPEGYISSTGKRKSARAKAYVRHGTGIVTINGKNLIHYCPDVVSRDRIIRPLMASKLVGLIDVKAEVHGGGIMGQGFALRQAIAKALIRMIPESSPSICSAGLIARDPRQVERKKTSRHKARKSYTFVKR